VDENGQDHKCHNEDLLKELKLLTEKQVKLLKIVEILLTPKMVLAILLGVAFIIQVLKGGG
jgi:hypothetical protein